MTRMTDETEIDVSTFEYVTGSMHDDDLTGDYRDNHLVGGGGDDSLRGGAGDGPPDRRPRRGHARRWRGRG